MRYEFKELRVNQPNQRIQLLQLLQIQIMFKTLKDCFGDPPLSSITPLKAPIFDNTQNRDTPQSPPSAHDHIHETEFFQNHQAIEYFPQSRQKKLADKRCWTPEEDNLLRQLICKYGAKCWSNLASHFTQRSGKQCRERWHNHLRDGVRKCEWTLHEEWILALAVRAHGNKWSTISKYLIGRTDNTIKNHWNCKMNPKKVKFQMRINQLLRNPDKNSTEVETLLLKKISQNPQRDIGNLELEEEVKLKNAMKAALKEFKELKRKFTKEINEEQVNELMIID